MEVPENGDRRMTQLATRSHEPRLSNTSWLRLRSRGASRPGCVYLHAPSFAFQAPGGGENQLLQTGRHLETQGVPVRLFSPWTDRLADARLLHLFGMSREGLELARRARAVGTPVVLSPICWFEPRALWSLEPTLNRKIRGLGAWAFRRMFSCVPGWRGELLRLSSVVLPNSRIEADQLVQLFGADPARIRVVPNGVLGNFQRARPELFRDCFGAEDFVLFVGRVEPRKNVLGLIKAARRLGVRLVVIGDAPPGAEEYLAHCLREANGLVEWLEGRDHDDPILASAYAAARVFALPSWFETPGLAALEAALAGCPIVITPFGSTREYFGDRAVYARPDRVSEIATAISTCWSRGPDPGLAGHVDSNYLWPVVAKKTAEAYDQVAE